MKLNLIEPTLHDQSGHCFGYVKSLLDASMAVDCSLRVWAGKRSRSLFSDATDCQPFFNYRVRRLQQIYLYWRLTREREIIFVPTASRYDLQLLARLAPLTPDFRVFLHFHQFRNSPKKRLLLQAIAKRRHRWVIMTPTEKLADIFRKAGFKYCEVVPCPTFLNKNAVPQTSGASAASLVYSGAARADKGFAHAVDLVEFLQTTSLAVPISLQISPPHSGRFDKPTRSAIKKLQTLHYPYLKKITATLSVEDYGRQFEQAIVLLLYDSQEYGDKFSGVALDAFRMGCPVITTANTWIAEMCTRFQAGIVVDNVSPATVYQAAKSILANFQQYQTRALLAGRTLEREHDPKRTLQVIQKYLRSPSGAV